MQFFLSCPIKKKIELFESEFNYFGDTLIMHSLQTHYLFVHANFFSIFFIFFYNDESINK